MHNHEIIPLYHMKANHFLRKRRAGFSWQQHRQIAFEDALGPCSDAQGVVLGHYRCRMGIAGMYRTYDRRFAYVRMSLGIEIGAAIDRSQWEEERFVGFIKRSRLE